MQMAGHVMSPQNPVIILGFELQCSKAGIRKPEIRALEIWLRGKSNCSMDHHVEQPPRER